MLPGMALLAASRATLPVRSFTGPVQYLVLTLAHQRAFNGTGGVPTTLLLAWNLAVATLHYVLVLASGPAFVDHLCMLRSYNASCEEVFEIC